MDNPDNQSGKPNITARSIVSRQRKVKGMQPKYRTPDAAEYAEAERKIRGDREQCHGDGEQHCCCDQAVDCNTPREYW